MATKTNTKRAGDLIKWEVYQGFTRKGVTLKHAFLGSVTIADPMGYPCIDNGDGTASLLESAAQATCNALLIYDKSLTIAQAGTKTKMTILRRGGALINKDALPSVDHQSVAFTNATLVTALEAENIFAQEESNTIETQTT